MSRHELNSYRWDGERWAMVEASELVVIDQPVRVATLNILADCFPWYIEMAIRSAERFAWLCDGIARLNPTIIGLNEVTMNALRVLQESPFIRENYFLTATSDGDSGLSPHGCIILSKLPLLEVFALPVSGSNRQAVVVKVRLARETCAYVCTHHTTAYQTAKNAQLRVLQIRDIVDVLRPLGLPFIIMGDLNLHYAFEDSVVIDNHLLDGWAQTHFSSEPSFDDADPGFTFDALSNTFIPYYIPGEQRQMRLDRILFSAGFPAVTKTPCAMWANQPIKSDSYLFPSDHFGLYIDLMTGNADPKNDAEMSMGLPDRSAEKVLRRNAANNTDQSSYRLEPIRTTLAMVVHAGWLAAVALRLK